MLPSLDFLQSLRRFLILFDFASSSVMIPGPDWVRQAAKYALFVSVTSSENE